MKIYLSPLHSCLIVAKLPTRRYAIVFFATRERIFMTKNFNSEKEKFGTAVFIPFPSACKINYGMMNEKESGFGLSFHFPILIYSVKLSNAVSV